MTYWLLVIGCWLCSFVFIFLHFVAPFSPWMASAFGGKQKQIAPFRFGG
jgi:hypothetical protein